MRSSARKFFITGLFQNKMKLTFEQFVQGLVDKFAIPSELIFIQSVPSEHFGKRGWHFSQPLSGCCDYDCNWIMPAGLHNTVGGGVIEYSHDSGYSIDCKGLAKNLTLDEVGQLFQKDIPGKGTFIGSYKPTPILK